MKSLQFAHVWAVALAIVAATATHQCIHGHADIQAEAERARATTVAQRYTEGHVGPLAAGRAPLRIVVFFDNLNDPTKYCTAVGDERPTYRQSPPLTAICTADDILTDDKRAFLRDDLVPSAVQRLSALLNVTRVVGPLRVGSMTVCGTDTIVNPSAVSPGVSDADFVLYVTAGPVSDAGTLAFAAPCASDGSTPIPRPIVGRANFNPRFLTRDATEPSAANTLARDTALHEICHALGFTQPFFGRMTTVGTIREKTVTWFNGPIVTAACQAYFNCSAQSPCAEIEDEGPVGSRGTHWDKRMTFEELMVASGGAYLSAFTLGMFEDMGMYTPNYGVAQTMVAGRGVGCPFLREKCNAPASNPFGEWCFVADQVGCTPDRRSIGPCAVAISSTPWPPEFRYFSNPNEGAAQVFTDGCPYRIPFSDRMCSFGATATSSKPVDGIFYYGLGGRCVAVNNLRRMFFSSSDDSSTRCLRVRCPFNGSRVEIQVGASWVVCDLRGQAGEAQAPDGYSGTVSCPLPRSICTDDVSFGSNVLEALPSRGSLPYGPGAGYFSMSMRLNGSQWTSLLAQSRSTVSRFENAIRIDMGQRLFVGSSQVRVNQLEAFPRSLLVQLSVLEEGSALSARVVEPELRRESSAPLVRTSALYEEEVGSPSAVVVESFTIAAMEGSSLCFGYVVDSACVVVVGSVAGLGVAGVFLGLACTVCVRGIPKAKHAGTLATKAKVIRVAPRRAPAREIAKAPPAEVSTKAPANINPNVAPADPAQKYEL